MYEGRNAKLFHPTTGVITWMSNPAQPSFVWQLYHYDLEPNASLFAVKQGRRAGPHPVQREQPAQLQVINNLPDALAGATAHVAVYNLDGTDRLRAHHHRSSAAPALATDLGEVALARRISRPSTSSSWSCATHTGKLLSENFYWRALPQQPDDLQRPQPARPPSPSTPRPRGRDADGKCLLTVTLHNPGTQVALMAHLQLRRKQSGERVLPVFYSDNYVSLVPNETRTITIEAAEADLKGDSPLVVVDGWNVEGASFTGPDVSIAPNVDAQVAHWPTTGLPIIITGTTEPPAQ